MYPTVTPEQEAANAAYVWRRKLQTEMAASIDDSDMTMEKIDWWVSRLRFAFDREKETHAHLRSDA